MTTVKRSAVDRNRYGLNELKTRIIEASSKCNKRLDYHRMMLFLWLLIVILSPMCAVFAVLDQQCFDNCSCCIDEKCKPKLGWPNMCTIGCIDGHRGARCYQQCQYPNCKKCGGTGPTSECTACYDGYYLGSNNDCTSQCPSYCKTCTSSTRCTECKEGFYDKDCTSQCPSNCKSCTSSTMCTECKEGFYDKDGSTTCKYVHCPANCECNGQGDCVSCKKGYYDTSASRTKQCPVNCLSCESEKICSECNHGFYNGYEYDNTLNLQLDNCTYECRDNCTQCQSYNKCVQCRDGKYGQTCQENCSIGCKDITCLFNSGQCTCTKDFTGDKCMKCVDGKYGLLCKETCSKYCNGKICERTSGNCSAGCINDNISGTTCNTCNVGLFGELCENICPENCKDIRCERYSGTCNDGCTMNFNGTMCDICIHGNYGTKCELKCPIHCAGNTCNRTSGTCFDCVKHFLGEMCDECKPGYYGPNCDVLCPLHCANYPCNRNTGNCLYGCKNGYSGDKCCVMSENCIECHTKTECKTCVSGFFKSSCNETCPGGCNNSCHISTGKCILSKVAQQQNDVSNSATAAVLGTMFTLSFSVIIVVLVLVMLKKIKVSWREHSQEDREPTYENQLKSVGEQFPRTTRNATDTLHSAAVERNVYEGISSVNEKEHEYQKVSFDHENVL